MKKILIFLFLSMLCAATAYAHAGRTDAYGGHYDNETGEYHYHHGYPAHEHIDGVCPYDFDDQTAHSSGNSSTSTATPKPELHLETPDPLSPPIASVQKTPSPTTEPTPVAKNNAGKSFIVLPAALFTAIGVAVVSKIRKKKKTVDPIVPPEPPTLPPPLPPPVPPPEIPEGYGIDDEGLPYKLNRVYGWGMEYNVYVTQHGHCYHRSKCKALKGKGKIKTLIHRYDALSQGYDVCRYCSPIEGIDDWFVEMFPDSEYAELDKKKN